VEELMIGRLKIRTSGKGLYEITDEVSTVVHTAPRMDGLATVFVQHTSASLLIQENADPSAKRDLEAWLNRLVPEEDSLFTHTFEGPDDMPAHVKAALTATSLSIPVVGGTMALGRWQGIYLWEHRDAPQLRNIVVQLLTGS
jgi:secondary thiamine-phosphate synthase enzyme